jgi:predicted lipoprotein with Yx(FWY)xxD motif
MQKTSGWPVGIVLAMVAALAFGVGTWAAAAAAVASTAPNVMVAQNTKLGNILTDNQGMTLYVFKKDKAGESACTGPCVKNWPPLTVAEGMQPVVASAIPGTLSQIERKDDTYQVTYNGMPLYRYAGDSKPGDTNGQGLGGLWFVVQITTHAATASGGSTKGW